jgi:hypothetical protein
MKIFDATNRELMAIRAIERDGNDLVIKGKIFGAMPMTARVRPEEARQVLRLLNWRLVLFLAGFLFRPATKPKAP